MFKIGITHDPSYRMFNPRYGYAKKGEIYSLMHVLVASYPWVCGYVERQLIHRFRTRAGCRNTADGGESAPPEGLCYVYVVTQPCGDGKPLVVR